MSNYTEIGVEKHGHVGLIEIRRPPLNFFDVTLINQIADALEEFDRDIEIRSSVLAAQGKAFCAGANFNDPARQEQETKAKVDPASNLPINHLYVQAVRIFRNKKPIVAAVQGAAVGGGLGLACAADFRVAGERARVGQPEILLGVIPGAGGTQRLSRLVGPARAKDIVFSGRMVGAAEALQIGLVDQVVPDAEVYQAAVDMVKRYASGPALALRAAKQAIDAGLGVDLATGLEIERVQFAALFGTEDQKAGMRSFLENGPGKATFEGR